MSIEVCKICGHSELSPVGGYDRLARVTSDCKPFPPGGALSICGSCGGVQKPATDAFLKDIGEIYGSYDVYFQGGGAEQMTLDFSDRVFKRRSDLLASRLLKSGVLNGQGTLLDFGCGNGAMLAAVAKAVEGWRLEGSELDERWAPQLAKIPGFAKLHVAGHDVLPEKHYDVITLIHALEHLTDPLAMLQELKSKLKPDGLLFIESPNLRDNPFDLLIADHASHFTPASVSHLLARAGFVIEAVHTDWVGKELSVLARPQATALEKKPVREDAGVAGAMDWLARTPARARAAKQPLTVFGTSIASVWLTSELGVANIAAYVDEDPARYGRTFFGKPILAPDDVPKGEPVFICLAPSIAAAVASRMSARGLTCVL